MMQLSPIFFVDLKDPYFKVERVTENVRFALMTHFIYLLKDLIHAQKRDIGSIFKISSSNIARTCFASRTVEFNSLLIMAGSPNACNKWIDTLTQMHRSLRNRFTSYLRVTHFLTLVIWQ